MKLHRNIIPIRCGAGATLRRIAFLLALMLFCAGSARAYDNEVYESEGNYYWKIDNVVQGSSAELFTAIDRCLWDSTGAGREIHILTGGDLSATIGIPGDVSLNGHSNTFHVTHGDYTVWAVGADNIGFYDMTITGASHMVFRVTACDNVVFSGIHIDGGFIGMRVDSRSSQPWLATSYNLTVTNCTFENLGSHGLETAGIDGCYVDNIVARNNGECGVLFNYTWNAYVGSVDAYRCSYGGGYAGLRFANYCGNIRVKYLKAVECGRGFFTVSDVRNVVVEEVYIRDCTGHDILLQYSDQVGINSGTYNGLVINHYTSQNCWILATDATGVTDPLPSSPASLTAVVNNDRVALNWSAVSGATSYRLQRASDSAGPFFTIAYSESTDFVDRDVVAGSNYYYRVRAVNAAGPGDPSTVDSVAISGLMTPVLDPTIGLTRQYAFNGSAADSQGGAAAVVSGTETYVDGLVNQALFFDGNSTFATLSSLSESDYRDFTVATWVWRDAETDWQRIFDFGSGTENYMMMTRIYGALRFDIVQNGILQAFQIEAPPLDRWVHVAVTFDGNWATFYMNGAPLKKVLFSNNPTHFDLLNNYLGKSQWPADPLFSGRLDDFRVYDRGLLEAEVMELVQNAPALPPFDLLAGGFGTKANLSWSGTVNADTYTVKRAEVSGGPYATVASGVTNTTYSDTTVSSDTTYYYIVTATNPNGESDPSNESAAVIADLTLHLTFDEGVGDCAADSSGNGWDAALVNGAAFGTGIIGSGLHITNSAGEHAALPSGVVSGLDDFTISQWARVSESSDWARIFDFGTGTDNYMYLTAQYGGSAARMRFAIRTPSVSDQQVDSSISLPLDTWAHVAVTRSGTTARIYLNGIEVGSGTVTLAPSDLGLTTQNYIGRSQWADPYFNGTIDDVRIYARALSAGEISDLAHPSPEAPNSIAATPGSGSAILVWSPATADTYNVKRSAVSGGPYTTVASDISSLSYTNFGLSNGTTYYYVVSSMIAQNASSDSVEVSVTPFEAISLTNSSFELPTAGKISDGFDGATDVPGWNDFGTMSNSGIEDPSFGGHDGTYSAVLMGGDGGAYQMTGYTIQEGDVFTLGYWAKIDWAASPCAITATLFGDTPNSGANEIGSIAADPLTGSWVYYECTATATVASVGQELGIQFVNTQSDWGAFDDVSLSVVTSSIDPGEWTIDGHFITGGTNLTLVLSNSVPGHGYTLLETDSLTPPVWTTNVIEAGTGSNLVFGIPLTGVASNRFFKLDVQRP